MEYLPHPTLISHLASVCTCTGILGSVAAAAAIYAAMSTVLVGMVKYSDLDTSAPFAAVFMAKVSTGGPY